VFFSLRNKEIRSLDNFTSAAGISQGNFTLHPPNTVLTEVWEGQPCHEVPLDLLCTSGKVFRVDPYDLQNHD
jgi:hypothetical protein